MVRAGCLPPTASDRDATGPLSLAALEAAAGEATTNGAQTATAMAKPELPPFGNMDRNIIIGLISSAGYSVFERSGIRFA